ncbi:amino acid synthesis family protein [Herbiconiux sp. CPCC 205763]|uniref:Amino acid synthesis family protein n=1 Tax=Herbiconiux aconitum TaxID=2970913 RepID=A0ABT2GSS1_9MICO|nr:amino acid synthesis family protein [Herbiconiux aconitum]MCS5719262.1 amino acid synthesis family protein [Herbiconiux aconitum]
MIERSTSDVTTAYRVRSWHSQVEEIRHAGGAPLDGPLFKAAVAVVIENPFAGLWQEDLSDLTTPSAALGTELGERAAALLGGRPVESYGKGGIAGIAGEQEHVVACITTVFGDAFRDAVGGGAAWISSVTKVGSAGVALDIPLAYKDALYVRSHYDAVTLSLPDAPKPGELVIAVAVATGGRPHARTGGLTVAEAIGDGVR